MTSALDDALAAAQKDQSKSDAFYDLFLRTVLIIPTVDGEGGDGAPRRAEEGASFNPVLLDNEGTPLLPVFDSERRLADWAKRAISFVGIPAHALLEGMDPSVQIALNIGCPGFKLFVVDELRWLRERMAAAGPERVAIPAGTQVLIGAPKEVPPELLPALRECLAKSPEVRAAHLGQLVLGGQGRPRLALVLKLGQASDSVRQAIQKDVGLAIRGKLGDRDGLDIMIAEGDGIGSKIAETVPAFFTA
ncbi:MAG: enhanced serine sensitivity protein SseB C-terminal domain-containing protein [Elusimicrobia bacterium]|nr:enhanced serine sensitivity protein SseB C-terminal domain-containing protein [Elusimicrobiota bacterium]